MSAVTVMQPDLQQGTVYSSPQPWEAGKTHVAARGLLSDEDSADTTKSLTICIEQSYDGGLSFTPGVKAPWQGGIVNPFAPPPFAPPAVSTGFSGSNNPPTHIRVRLDLPQQLSVGATVTFS